MHKYILFSQFFFQLICFGLLPKPKSQKDKFKRVLEFQKEITDTLEKIAKVEPKASQQFAQTILNEIDKSIDIEPEVLAILHERNRLIKLIGE